jgi:glycosyltransferase EpsF
MRVLHLINAFNRGGIEKWLLSMIAEIPRSVCELDVCCKGSDLGPWAPLAAEHGARLYHCPFRPSHVGFVRGLSRILREHHYDLIHNHLGIYSGLPVWVGHRAGVPVVTTFQNNEFSPAAKWLSLPLVVHLLRVYARLSVRYAIVHSDLLTAVSQGILEDVVPHQKGLREKSRLLYLGTAIPPVTTTEEKRAFRESMGWSADAPVIMHVGRFFRQKNHVGLLKVFERVLPHVPHARLVLVGTGPLVEEVEKRVRQAGLSASVRMLGAIDDAASLIAKCDVFLFPSLWEGFGIVALEANASGVPVVGSDVVGLNEAVENGQTALLFSVDDTESMAMAVVRILSDPLYAARLGDAGRMRAERLFSVSAAAERLLNLYRHLLARSAVRDPSAS